ncbi:MAG: ABC transporter permease, partial [Oscillospiraceae bacterium]|nr:ABC transporter permease [Oscillospiraceae bacterium]
EDKAEEICERLRNELPQGFKVSVSVTGDSTEDRMISQAAAAIKTVIYIISAAFAFAAVTMVCTRIFAHEKTDIGIYKALGFTSGRLRLQFAMRFLIVALIGVVTGTALSLIFSERLLSVMLRSMGIAEFVIDYRFATIFMPIAAVLLSFFIFSFITASRIKKVEIRTLITE